MTLLKQIAITAKKKINMNDTMVALIYSERLFYVNGLLT